jgi:hypothetical protein
MKHIFPFTFSNLRKQYEAILNHGYHVVSCAEYAQLKRDGFINTKILVNRVDIDLSCRKAKRLAILFNDLNIKATFFVRLHADEYNPFSFENYRCLKFIRDTGYEIGFHSEIIDESVIWDEEATDCLLRDIDVLNRMLGIQIKGVASHGGLTGLNNLDFWKDRKSVDFGLLYEAYDREQDFNLFHESFFISDSNWTYWKCYNRGIEVPGDLRTPAEHIRDGHPLIYLLIHPDTYFDEHFYE